MKYEYVSVDLYLAPPISSCTFEGRRRGSSSRSSAAETCLDSRGEEEGPVDGVSAEPRWPPDLAGVRRVNNLENENLSCSPSLSKNTGKRCF